MATRYRFGHSYEAHFVTFSVVDWVDALSRPLYKDTIVKSLKYCIEKKDLKLHAWVIMNNHVHLIISSEKNKLENIMRDLKRHTSKELLKTISNDPHESRRRWMMWLFKSAGEVNSNNTHFQFWQQDNHPIHLSDEKMAMQKLAYIHENPVRAGITFGPEHYVYSSAVDYYLDRQGLLPIVRLD